MGLTIRPKCSNMRLKVIIPFLLFALLMVKSSFAWFANFCQFDRITWSPDGQKIAFESRYIPTGTVYTYLDTLIVDLSTGKLTCVTPEMHQFILSIDRKRILFSSTYGLYIMDLKPISEPEQVFLWTLRTRESS